MLTTYCADQFGPALREIYTTWTYSETVRYARMLHDRQSEIDEHIADSDDPLVYIMLQLARQIS